MTVPRKFVRIKYSQIRMNHANGHNVRRYKMQTKWKTIKNYENLYMVSNTGKVYSIRYKKVMVARINNSGYYTIELHKNGHRKTCLVHRLVAKAFLSNPKNYLVVNHKDENKLNNTVDNLEWCTIAYNNLYGTKIYRHSVSRGTPCKAYNIKTKVTYLFHSDSQCANYIGTNHSLVRRARIGILKQTHGYVIEQISKDFIATPEMIDLR